MILAFLVLGFLLATHYGETSDEEFRIDFARRTLVAYQTGQTFGLSDEKGTFYSVFALLGTTPLALVTQGWAFIDRWHLMTYFSFVLGVFFFYRLSRRMIKPWPALVTTSLFATQPLIWGHAFINPKDMPFMAFFLTSVSLGLDLVDRFAPKKIGFAQENGWTDLRGGFRTLAEEWKKTSRFFKRLLITLGVLIVGVASSPLWAMALLRSAITWMYSAPTTSVWHSLFARVAQKASTTAVDLYINKAEANYPRNGYLTGFSLVIAIFAVWFLSRPSTNLFGWLATFFSDLKKEISQTLRDFGHWLSAAFKQSASDWRTASQGLRAGMIVFALLLVALIAGYPAFQSILQRDPFTRFYSLASFPMFAYWVAWLLGILLTVALLVTASKVFPALIGKTVRYLAQPRTLVAACFLGLVSDIRTLGPASGILVAFYFVMKRGVSSIVRILEYLLLGGFVTYALWPFLWESPIKNYLFALAAAADFGWSNIILFAGKIYDVVDVPPQYVFTPFALQLTDAALIAILFGLLIGLVLFLTRKNLRLDILMLILWFISPIAAAIVLDSTVYDNARQFLFCVPPLFLLAGLAFQYLWDHLRSRLVFALIAVALIFQGVYWDVSLHPYEYIYYNSLTGNVRGAYRNYDLDYWGSSYKEVFAYVNRIAPPGAGVYVYVPYSFAATYLRPDLKVHYRDDFTSVDFAVMITKRNKDQSIYPNSKEIYQVERDGGVLSVLKLVNQGDPTGVFK